jgi:hypothetical protein
MISGPSLSSTHHFHVGRDGGRWRCPGQPQIGGPSVKNLVHPHLEAPPLQMQSSPCCRCASDRRRLRRCGPMKVPVATNSLWPSPCLLYAIRRGPMLSYRVVLHLIPAKFISHLAATTTSDGSGLERAGLRMVTLHSRLSC